MSLSAIFALGSMVCAGVNDFIFKKYVSKTRSKGVYLSLIGVVRALILNILCYLVIFRRI